MKYLFLISCIISTGCINSSKDKDICKYSLEEYLKSDCLTVNPILSRYGDIEQCVDERNSKSFGGIYAFANSGEYYIYRFYLDSNRFTYEESNRDSILIPESPVVYYRIGIDNSKTTYISIYYFKLNRQISNLVLMNKNEKVKDIHHEKTNDFSNIYISDIYFPKYTPEEIKSKKIYIEGDVLLCNGKKTHFKEPLIWNKEEAEKYASP